MTIAELKKILSRSIDDDREVKIIIAEPYIGARASSLVANASFGSGWNDGLLLHTEDRLVRKNDKQDIYESAQDLLILLATECFVVKREKYENKTARNILNWYGFTDDELRKYVKLFHRGKEIIK